MRRFKRDPLPDGMIERLIGLACLSPSVGLSEPWRFVMVDDGERRAAIRKAFPEKIVPLNLKAFDNGKAARIEARLKA